MSLLFLFFGFHGLYIYLHLNILGIGPCLIRSISKTFSVRHYVDQGQCAAILSYFEQLWFGIALYAQPPARTAPTLLGLFTPKPCRLPRTNRCL